MCLQSLYRLMKTDKNQFSREAASSQLRAEPPHFRQTSVEVMAETNTRNPHLQARSGLAVQTPEQQPHGLPCFRKVAPIRGCTGVSTSDQTASGAALPALSIPRPQVYKATRHKRAPDGNRGQNTPSGLSSHLCQSRRRKLTGIQMLKDREG